MAPPIDPHAFLALLETTITQMYELEAVGKLLEEKGLLTRAEILEKATALKGAAALAPAADLMTAGFTAQDISQATH